MSDLSLHPDFQQLLDKVESLRGEVAAKLAVGQATEATQPTRCNRRLAAVKMGQINAQTDICVSSSYSVKKVMARAPTE